MDMVEKYVAIFGRSDISINNSIYKEAFKCSKCLSEKGFAIITGGYGGIMEAASKGAIDGKLIGVPCSEFKARRPNPYLKEVIWATNLFERQRILIERSDAFVAFEPKAGTLSEVFLIFALRKSGKKVNCPVCFVGKKWSNFMDFLKKERIISKNLLKYVFMSKDGKEAARSIINFFEEKEVFSGKR